MIVTEVQWMNRTRHQAKSQNSRSLRDRSTAHRAPSKYPPPSKINGYHRDISYDIYRLNVVYLWVKQKWAAATTPQQQRGSNHDPQTKNIHAGGDLLSHTLPSAVPSALVDLASGFGMGPGVTPPLTPPTKTRQQPTPPQNFGWVVSCQTLNSRREQKP